MTEVDRFGITTVLAADADFEVGTNGSTFVGAHLYQRCNCGIDGAEGVCFEDSRCDVVGEELATVVAAATAIALG